MKKFQWKFQSKNTKQPFYDMLNFTLEADKEDIKLVNEKQIDSIFDEQEVQEISANRINQEKQKMLSDIEISHILQDYMEKYPEFVHQKDKKINSDKIQKDIQKIEQQIYIDQLLQEENFNDMFNNQVKSVLLQDKQRISRPENYFFDTLPEIKPQYDNLQNFMISVDIDLKNYNQQNVYKNDKGLKFQANRYKNYSESLISQGQDKSIYEIDGYLKSIEMAKQYPFELDEFQKRAIYFIEKNQDVFVAAHTSAGKTVVAEYAIAKSLKNKSKVIFTSPIKALSNQKYYEFQDKFNKDVGIITGDVVLKQESNCLIMTTEILRNKLFKKCDSLENLEWVIFDEVHYINDMERGSVWEETIILLPKNVGIVMLSATVENVGEFADWVTRTTGKKLNVLRTYHRPVPLVHHIFYGKEVTIKQHGKDFDELAYRQMLKDIENEKKKKKVQKDMKRKQLIQKKLELMEKSNQKERVRKITRSRTEKNKFYFSKEIQKMPLADDRNSMKLINMIKKLDEKEKLPAIVFIFSKKKLNSLAEKAADNLNLVTPDERKQISVFFERSIRRLKPEDKQILQIQSLKKMLLKGIGMHHGDLLWICKEIVELLFTKNLLKLLFATESFAMGINVPTKTVIFFTIEKNDGQSFRLLKSGEYTQMCGRAGRRGIDTEGNVYIFFGDTDDIPQTEKIRPMLQNKGEILESKFKLTYPTIINSFTMNNFKVKDLMKKSFTENKSYLKIIALKSRNALLKEEKQEYQIRCKFSDENPLDLQKDQFIVYHKNLIDQILELNKKFMQESSSKQIAKMIDLPGIYLILDHNMQIHPVIIETYRIDKNDIYFDCFIIEDATHTINISLNKSPIKKTVFIQQNDVNLKINNYEIYFNDILYPIEKLQIEALSQHEKIHEILCKVREKCRKEIPSKIQNTLSQKIDAHYQQIDQLCQKISKNQCYTCDQLKDHLSTLNKRRKIDLEFEENDKKVKKEEGSFGIDQFNSLLNILQELKFLDENKLPNMNMKFAKALSSGPEVILLTFVFNNHLLANLQPFEIPPLLSLVCMVGKKYPDYDKLDELIESQSFSESLVKSIDALVDCFQMVKQKELQHNVVFEDYIAFDMVLPIYQWCSGCDFRMLCTFTDKMEGYIVRIISKIEKYMEGLKALYQEQKNIEIVQKIELANQLLRRDILNVQSLYLN